MSLIYSVPQNHVVLIQRFGKHSRMQKDGLRFRIPLIESIVEVPEWGKTAVKDGYIIELSTQQTESLSRQCQTEDNVTIEVSMSIYWRIFDAIKAVYDVDVLPRAVEDTAMNILRSKIGAMSLDEALSGRQNLNDKIAAELHDLGERWGVLFTRVEIQEIKYSNETADVMLQVMAAERKKKAIMTEAEGHAEAKIMKAKADAQALEINAKAQAEAIKIVAEAESFYLDTLKEKVPANMAAEIIMSQKYIDGMRVISENPSDKVFLPNNFNGLLNLSTDSKNKSN